MTYQKFVQAALVELKLIGAALGTLLSIGIIIFSYAAYNERYAPVEPVAAMPAPVESVAVVPEPVIFTPAPFIPMEEAEDAVACLTEVIYFEGRSEPVVAQYAIGELVVARMQHDKFPDSICGVVREGYVKGSKTCQFSYYCDGLPDVMHEEGARLQAEAIARSLVYEPEKLYIEDELYYHTVDVRFGSWANRTLEYTRTVGYHMFYRLK